MPAMHDIKPRLNRRMMINTCRAGNCKVQTVRIGRRTAIRSVRALMTPATRRDHVWSMQLVSGVKVIFQ
jgi:hypothetical protein